jgi:hypothetical protein
VTCATTFLSQCPQSDKLHVEQWRHFLGRFRFAGNE